MNQTHAATQPKSAQQTDDFEREPVGRRESTAVPTVVHEVLQSPGEPLDPRDRQTMEARFQQDFSHVRVHNDGRAADSANMVQARAYTAGSHVVFNRRQYAPATASGRALLAHELTHVVQQAGSAAPLPQQIGAVDAPAEREANVASRFASGDIAVQQRIGEPLVQRVPWSMLRPNSPRPEGVRLPGSVSGETGEESRTRRSRNFQVFRAAEEHMVNHYHQRRGRTGVISNVDTIEEVSDLHGRQGDMLDAIYESFRSRRPSVIRRTQPIGNLPEEVTVEPGENPLEVSMIYGPELGERERFLYRPDILDLNMNEVYDVTTERQAPNKVGKVDFYVRFLEAIRRSHDIEGPTWAAGTTLPAPDSLSYDTMDNIQVWFGHTDLEAFPGVLAYEPIVRREEDERQQQPQEEFSWSDYALESLIDALAGEWVEDPTLLGMVGDLILGLIPYVDQAADVRDILAHLYYLTYGGEYDDPWRWVGLIFTLIGAIPEFGTVIKQISRVIIKKADNALIFLRRILRGVLRDVDPEDMRRLFDAALRELADLWADHVDQIVRKFQREIDGLLARIDDALVQAQAALLVAWGSLAQHIQDFISRMTDFRRVLNQLRESAPARLSQYADWARASLEDFIRELEAAVAGRARRSIEDVPTPPRVRVEPAQVQEAEDAFEQAVERSLPRQPQRQRVVQ